MTSMQAVGVYIAVNILLVVYLAIRVVSQRLRTKVGIGDGGDEKLGLAIRVHGNATENIPVAMAGLLSLAFLSAPALWIHIAGGAFTLGRLLHAFGFGGGVIIFRQIGMMLTWLALLGLAGAILWQVFA
ncbi:MAG: MAPEG family protein [Pseudomonadota bacterium]